MSTVNLLPKDYLQRRAKRRANALCLGLFVIVMGGVLGAWLVSERKTRRTQEILERLDAEYAQAVKLIQQMQRLQAQQRELQRKAEMTSSLVERIPRSTILAAVTNACPKNLSLLELKLRTENKKKAVAETSRRKTKYAAMAKKRGIGKEPVRTIVKMTIIGLAGTDLEVAQFMTNLARYRLIESVDLVETKQKVVDDRTVREFEITANLMSDVDAIDIVGEIGLRRPRTKKAPDASSWWNILGGRS